MLFQAELGSAQQLEQLFKTWQVDEADRTQQQFKKLEVSPEGLDCTGDTFVPYMSPCAQHLACLVRITSSV